MRPLLVGEANPYGGDPRYALYPDPPNSAGDRLCRVILGLTAREYLRKFDRVNLCGRTWRSGEARSKAVLITSSRYGKGSPVVLLGSKVASAFNVEFLPFSVVRGGVTMVILPHPSGRNLLWNDPKSVGVARRALEEAGVMSWNEVDRA